MFLWQWAATILPNMSRPHSTLGVVNSKRCLFHKDASTTATLSRSRQCSQAQPKNISQSQTGKENTHLAMPCTPLQYPGARPLLASDSGKPTSETPPPAPARPSGHPAQPPPPSGQPWPPPTLRAPSPNPLNFSLLLQALLVLSLPPLGPP